MFKLKGIQSMYCDRVKIFKGNLLLLWKFGFQDRMDRGNRVTNFLLNIGMPQPWVHESNL